MFEKSNIIIRERNYKRLMFIFYTVVLILNCFVKVKIEHRDLNKRTFSESWADNPNTSTVKTIPIPSAPSKA